MNAIFDAPVGPDKKPVYNHLDRTKPVQLAPEHQGLLRYASDGVFIAVSVQDPFGSLEPETILRYLESCYGEAAGSMNGETAAKGGAGRGLHQIVEGSDAVIFNIQPGRKTEVIALCYVEVKEASSNSPSLQLFLANSN